MLGGGRECCLVILVNNEYGCSANIILPNTVPEGRHLTVRHHHKYADLLNTRINHEMDKKARGINSTLPPLPDILKSCFPRSSIKLPRYEVELLQLVFGVSTSPECPVSGAAPLS